MKKILPYVLLGIMAAAFAIATSSPAPAGYEGSLYRHGGHGSRAIVGITTFPPHWLLDRGPRVLAVPYKMDGSGPAIPFNDNPDWGRDANNGRGCRSCFDATK